VLTIETTDPSAATAQDVLRAYTTEVASRWYGRTATEDEVVRALADEPSDDLRAPTGAFLVAVEDDRAVGCVGVRWRSGSAELTKVFTRPEHRGRGVATRLLDAAEGACRANGVDVVRLDTRAELAEACALYERRGYERVDPFNDEPYSDRWYAKQVGR